MLLLLLLLLWTARKSESERERKKEREAERECVYVDVRERILRLWLRERRDEKRECERNRIKR